MLRILSRWLYIWPAGFTVAGYINTSLYCLPQAAEAQVPPQPAICPLKMIRLHNWGHDLSALSLCTSALVWHHAYVARPRVTEQYKVM